MGKKYTHWTDDLIIEEGKRYYCLTDFRKLSIGAHKAAKKRGEEFFNKVINHMIIRRPYKKTKVKWNKVTIKNEAKKYQYKIDFMKKSVGACNQARRFGKDFFNEITSHMVKKMKTPKYSDEQIINESKKYEYYSDLIKDDKSLYSLIRTRKLQNKVSLKRRKGKPRIYDDEYIINEGSKYDYASDFMKHNHNLYCHAQQHNLLSKIKYKKKGSKFNLYKRLVYVYEFPDNHFYCGLTYHETKRHVDHMKTGPVYNHMLEHNMTPKKKIVSDGYILCSDAQILEEEIRIKYIQNGWISLNKQKGGAVGGGRIKWTEKKVREVAKKYEFLHEFVSENGGANIAARILGIREDIIKNMKLKYQYDKETCRKIVQKYFSYSDIIKTKDFKYYKYIYKMKWDKELLSHFGIQRKIILDTQTGVYYYNFTDAYEFNSRECFRSKHALSSKSNNKLKVV